MNLGSPNQALQATAVKRLGWQVGCQRPAVPILVVGRNRARFYLHIRDNFNLGSVLDKAS